MATSTMIPYSNPAGNNQTTPTGVLASGGPKLPGAVPMSTPGASPVGMNPLVPTGAVPASPSIPNVGGLTNSPANAAGTTGGLDKQLTDIYGKGIGGALGSLLTGMSGTDSQILQEYIQSLQPEEAKAQAGVGAALGAGGVSANSSVAGLADANLQAQEFSAIAGESANLTQSQEQLTAQILTGMEPSAQKEVASSGWSVFGDVMGDIATDVGAVLHGGQGAMPGNVSAVPGAASQPFFAPQLTNFGPSEGPAPDNFGLDVNVFGG
jgi:hypothetical protein